MEVLPLLLDLHHLYLQLQQYFLVGLNTFSVLLFLFEFLFSLIPIVDAWFAFTSQLTQLFFAIAIDVMLLRELIVIFVAFIVPFFVPSIFFDFTAQFFFFNSIFIFLKPP